MGSNVFLTQTELYKLRQMCANPFLELGSTMRPKHLACLEKHFVSRSSKVTILFPTTESVEKWNLMHETRIRTAGHGATVALTVAVGALGGYLGAVGAGVVSAGTAIAKDELQAHVWYPKVHRGWTLTRTYAFRYQQYPDKYLKMNWEDLLTDERGVETERRARKTYVLKVGGESGVPEHLVGKLMTELPPYSNITFR